LESPRLERRLLRRPGSLFVAILILRRARLLLSSQPSAVRNAFSEAADSSSVETRNRRVGYQLCQPALRAEGIYNELQMEPVDYTTASVISKNPAIKYSVKPQLRSLSTTEAGCIVHGLHLEFVVNAFLRGAQAG